MSKLISFLQIKPLRRMGSLDRWQELKLENIIFTMYACMEATFCPWSWRCLSLRIEPLVWARVNPSRNWLSADPICRLYAYVQPSWHESYTVISIIHPVCYRNYLFNRNKIDVAITSTYTNLEQGMDFVLRYLGVLGDKCTNFLKGALFRIFIAMPFSLYQNIISYPYE